ncbi:hypothetical protein H7J08_15125 [Mycobacterium frederiksbergense]|uniref:hypothetical protein n=1 Tax=Mycolicibacterium frederiksbergense TaxID=117567 RepID=UPI0021F34C24|nr:hypothetical protein [Mycolicibacterium frederiksbergense]MCV7045989.1 hypothetical protein [Mycolicibacterium frederiksbergense]
MSTGNRTCVSAASPLGGTMIAVSRGLVDAADSIGDVVVVLRVVVTVVVVTVVVEGGSDFAGRLG